MKYDKYFADLKARIYNIDDSKCSDDKLFHGKHYSFNTKWVYIDESQTIYFVNIDTKCIYYIDIGHKENKYNIVIL